jgi:cytochrome b-561 domain containing protein 2
LITLSLLFVQFLLGAGSVWFGGVAFGGGQKAKLVWKYHRLIGYLALLSLVTTVHLGGWSTWVSAHSIYAARVVAYNLAPLGILLSLYFRIRCPVSFLAHPQDFSNQSLLGHQR